MPTKEIHSLKEDLRSLKGIKQLQEGRKAWISQEMTRVKELESTIMDFQSQRLSVLSQISKLKAEFERTERNRVAILQKKHSSIPKEDLLRIYKEVEEEE